MAQHNLTGQWGENLACDFLTARGYHVAERNWRVGHLEVDIIAFKGDRIVFVEVKTRSTHAVDPLEAIDSKRIRHLTRAANAYIVANNIRHEAQFDLILIIGEPHSAVAPEIEHIPDAFFPPLRTIR
ncbi:MAG: YraN family protein [Muribaculaceae bacterium]|nr:YraN family protein [Muribaculaceae bacterium]